MSNKNSTPVRSVSVVGFAVANLLLVAGNARAQSICAETNADDGLRNEVNVAISTFGSRLVAVGRVDAVSKENGIEVLGFRTQPTSGDDFQIGDYAAVIEWSPRGATERILEVRPLASRYVPGASEVFVKASIASTESLRGHVRLGRVVVDYSTSLAALSGLPTSQGSMLAVRGTQPGPNGVILGNCISTPLEEMVAARRARPDGSLGTGRLDGSLGTGRPDGSLGTGRADGSLGTGKADGSLGTGRPDGSLGTGKADGSLGTGRADGSLGTGKADGSLGTGKADGSLGTGRPDGSLGTGKADGSLGTGRADGSLGTGKADGSLGTGRPDGSLGTGKADGSLGTGRADGSLGTGKADGSLGTGKADGSLGTGRADGSLGTGKADGSLGTGKADGSLGTGRPDGSLGTGRSAD